MREKGRKRNVPATVSLPKYLHWLGWTRPWPGAQSIKLPHSWQWPRLESSSTVSQVALAGILIGRGGARTQSGKLILHMALSQETPIKYSIMLL